MRGRGGFRTLAVGVVAGLVAALAVTAPAARAEAPDLVGAYNQIAADGRYTGLGQEGVEHALVAFASIARVTGDDEHRRTFETLLGHILSERPAYMGSLFGFQVLNDPALRADPRLAANVRTFADGQLRRFAADPQKVLRSGDIRTLTGSTSFLLAYADWQEEAPPQLDAVIRDHLDRLVALQLTRSEAAERFGNEHLVGAFPHLVTGDDGSMGAWDVHNWSPAMLSIETYSAVRALAQGYGRYGDPAYGRAAASASRHVLSTRDIHDDLIYAGEPSGFPLDGAEFTLPEETGETLYLLTYGWSPNAIGDLGTALQELHDNHVTVPRDPAWAQEHWLGTPPHKVTTPGQFRKGLRAKLAFTHRFVEATQLPVSPDFPWLDLDRTTYPGTGDDPVRRDGWYDGSGRGTMSAVYSRIMTNGYVASGGRDRETLDRAAQWWSRMLVWSA